MCWKSRCAALPETKWSKAWGSKIPKLLAVAGAAILVTWLPDPPTSGEVLELTDNNMEHVAATAAAVQNVLLAAEARGMFSYWSSGGILGDGDVFDWLRSFSARQMPCMTCWSQGDCVKSVAGSLIGLSLLGR
jgi:nitroreductase